jgi:hypothetical protein
VTALDFDTQELIGKIQFKHEILQIEIKLQYLLVAFMNKIIVCDVYSLKHLFKLDTGDEDAIFDSHVQVIPVPGGHDRHELRIANIGDDEKNSFTVQNCTIVFLNFCSQHSKE